MDQDARGGSPSLVHTSQRWGALTFAGIWQSWSNDGETFDTCAIVMTPANDTMSQIHHRMPVIVPPSDWSKWLGEDGKGAATLMRAAPNDALSFFRVDTAVNSNCASGAQLRDPMTD